MPSSYIIDPVGGVVFGNEVSPIASPADPAAFKTLLIDPPDGQSSFVERLSDGRDSNRIITQQEVDLLQKVMDEGPESWEVIKDDGKVSAHRYKNRSLFKGCLFGTLQAHLPNVSKELVAHAMMGLTEGCERGKWDHQVFGFKVYPAPGGNQAIYYKMAAPPFSTRDFICLHVLCRRKEGGGILTYMRSTVDALAPTSRDKVRARAYCIASEITDDPAGGTRFKTTTVLDPAIPFLPAWVINMFIPMEFAKWVDSLEKHCTSLMKAGVLPASVPSAAAFLPRLVASDPAAVLPVAASREDAQIEALTSPPAATISVAAGVEAPAGASVSVAAADAAADETLPAAAEAAAPEASDRPPTAAAMVIAGTTDEGLMPVADSLPPTVFADDVAPKTGWFCCASK